LAGNTFKLKTVNGLTTIPSNFSVEETINRLAAIITSGGLSIFARIDHAANAKQAGLTLRPTYLIIFGSPKAGTPLMQDNQTSGIDLPLKALAWEDEAGKVWLTCNETSWLATRHHLGEKTEAAIKNMDEGMKKISLAAAGK
jgi:uncharacterized protein (DUF302 family)